ncbi:hypothetical protein KAR91_09010 [Candidatus Pacearchaeota archaeon]|nr:hypothetical protein [Candidatus Pacearchaeota archaeon]
MDKAIRNEIVRLMNKAKTSSTMRADWYNENGVYHKLGLMVNGGEVLSGYSKCSSCGWQGIDSAKKKILREGRSLKIHDLVCPLCGERGFYEV